MTSEPNNNKLPDATEIIQFLKRQGEPPEGHQEIPVVQTHASYVGITRDYVFKIKKEVNLGFLDFSSLEKRHYYCVQEIKLNSRICPQIYIGVLPLLRNGSGELIAGETDTTSGADVEYAVYMHRLGSDDFLHHRLEDGSAGEKDLDAVASKIAAFYNNMDEDSELVQFGQIDYLRLSTDENFEQLRPYTESLFPLRAIELLEYYTNRFFEKGADLLGRRASQGWIRDCHGDLHLEHIHISNNDICIFDCIEFNDRFRYIDIVNDYGFLAMDLDYNGYSYLARHFAREMMQRTQDPEAMHLVDFYKVYRAVVRAKVHAFTSASDSVSADRVEYSRRSAFDYIRLAMNYSISGSRPLLLGLTGQVGSGKSALARRLHELLGFQWLSSDRIRKEVAGLPVYERPDEDTRNWLYSSEMSRKTYDTLFETARKMIELDQSVILDATFNRQENRDRLRSLAESLDCDYVILETTARDEVRMERLGRREHNTDEVSDARSEDFELLSSHYEDPSELPGNVHIQVNTEGSHGQTLHIAVSKLIDRNVDHSLRTSPG